MKFPSWLWAELSLVTSTTARNLRDNPQGFLLLVARRFAPGGRRRLPVGGRGVPGALAAYLADRPEAAAAALRGRRVGWRPADRVAARLAVEVGAPEGVPSRLRDDPRVLADQAWAVGDLSRAVALLAGSRGLAARRRVSELRLLQPGFRLEAGTAPPRPDADRSRVLHILTNSLPHTRSGYTARTHAILRACRDAGLVVAGVTRLGYPTTIGRLGARPVDVVDGISYHRLLAPSLPVDAAGRLTQQVRALDALVAEFRPGVLHTTTDFTNALITEALARRHGLPWVYEMRGQLELTWVASRPEPLRAQAADSERVRLLRAKEAELASAADAVVVLSQVQADDLVARGVAAGLILVAPNSIDTELLQHEVSPADGRRALGLPSEGVWAGTVSSLVDYEGLDTFLRALAEVRRGGVDLRGAIVGEGVSRPGLLDLAQDLGVADAVVFPGRVSKADAVRWHEALDVFVVPRRDTPVCRVVTPLKPVEAMALGRPVVASDLPALCEVVKDAGVLVRAGDVAAWAAALAGLARDGDRRARCGSRGREIAAERSWQHVADALVNAYRKGKTHG